MTGGAPQNRRFIIISGLSGAGKSVALNTLEDLEFYCIDNLPVSLLDQLIRQAQEVSTGLPPCIAVGIDARNPESVLAALPQNLDRLKGEGLQAELVFMEANDEVLTSRFSETRRRHPLSTGSNTLPDAIRRERELLGTLSDLADLRIDTSFTAVHELRDLVRRRIAGRSAATLSLQFVSFGYKHGVPRDADFVFDVRCLPNPHWDKELRKFSGRDKEVVDFLRSKPAPVEMLEELKVFLDKWLPRFEEENRSYLCIAVGCTGGHHRSVFIVEQLGRHFQDRGRHVIIRHRDL